MQPWREIQIFGNEVWRWSGLLGSVALLLAVGRIGRNLMRKAADRIGPPIG